MPKMRFDDVEFDCFKLGNEETERSDFLEPQLRIPEYLANLPKGAHLTAAIAQVS